MSERSGVSWADGRSTPLLGYLSLVDLQDLRSDLVLLMRIGRGV